MCSVTNCLLFCVSFCVDVSMCSTPAHTHTHTIHPTKHTLKLYDISCTLRHTYPSQPQEDPTYIFAVCPEKGLTQQKFRCGSCTQLFNGPSAGAKLCDYTGLYHCRLCHHGDVSIIPARVLHNWDFKTKKVNKSFNSMATTFGVFI